VSAHDISDALRRAIERSDLTCYAIAKQAGLRPEVVTRFANEGRDIRLTTAAKLASVLGLQLNTKPTRNRKK